MKSGSKKPAARKPFQFGKGTAKPAAKGQRAMCAEGGPMPGGRYNGNPGIVPPSMASAENFPRAAPMRQPRPMGGMGTGGALPPQAGGGMRMSGNTPPAMGGMRTGGGLPPQAGGFRPFAGRRQPTPPPGGLPPTMQAEGGKVKSKAKKGAKRK